MSLRTGPESNSTLFSWLPKPYQTIEYATALDPALAPSAHIAVLEAWYWELFAMKLRKVAGRQAALRMLGAGGGGVHSETIVCVLPIRCPCGLHDRVSSRRVIRRRGVVIVR